MTTNIEISRQQTLKNTGFTSRTDRIENIIATIYEADKDETSHRSMKVEGILRLAKEMEQMMVTSGQNEQVNEICGLICRRFENDGRVWLARDTVEILDAKYKRKRSEVIRQATKVREQSSLRSEPPGSDLPVECSIMAKDVVNWLVNFNDNFEPVEVDDRTNQKILDLAYEITHKQEEYCDKNHLARHNVHDVKTPLDQANDDADMPYREKISKPRAPIARSIAIVQVDKEAYEQTLGLAKDIEEWAKKQIEKYSSQRLDQAIRWRDSIIAIRKIIRQYLDDKARRTIAQWAKINSNMAQHGGTAASSMSAQPVFKPGTHCEQLIDPESLKPVYRTITKEQIDARGPQYCVDIDFIIRQVVLTQMMEERYIQIECGFGEWRAYAASPKLSRNA